MPTKNLQPFSLYGDLIGTAWTSAPNGQLVCLWAFSQEYWIMGYESWIYGFVTMSPVPVLAPFMACVIGSQQTTMQIPLPFANPTNRAINNVLFSNRPQLNYMPANGGAVPPRPEMFSGSSVVSHTFQPEQYVHVPVGAPVGIYISLAGLTAFDSAFTGVNLYTTLVPPQ